MELFEALATRYSVRMYAPDPVPQDDLDRIFEAVRLSQSAGNRQWWKFVVVNDSTGIAAVADDAKMQPFVKTAPVLIACCATSYTYVMRCGQNNAPIDVAIAMENLALAAHGLGYGTCWFGSFDQQPVKKLLEVPEHAVVIGLMTLGVPGDTPKPKNRKTLDEIVSYGTWNGTGA